MPNQDGFRDNGVESPYNKGAPEKDLTLERDQEEMPMIREIIKIIASHVDELPIGTSVDVAVKEEYFFNLIQDEIMPLLVAKNMKVYDITYLHQCALESFDRIFNGVATLLNKSVDEAECIKWGLTESVRDLRIGQVNETLATKSSGSVDKSSVDESK